MRGGYRGKPKPKLPPHLKRVHVNARIQKWMLDELKEEVKLESSWNTFLLTQDLSINLQTN